MFKHGESLYLERRRRMMAKMIADPSGSSELSDLLHNVQSLREKFLAVEQTLDGLTYSAKTTDELSRAEREFIASVKERHTLTLRCRGWALRHHTDNNETFADLDDLFDFQEKLVEKFGNAYSAILRNIVYSRMGYPSR